MLSISLKSERLKIKRALPVYKHFGPNGTFSARLLKRALEFFLAGTQGGASLRSACPGLNSSVRSAASVSCFMKELLEQFTQRFIHRSHAHNSQTKQLLQARSVRRRHDD